MTQTFPKQDAGASASSSVFAGRMARARRLGGGRLASKASDGRQLAALVVAVVALLAYGLAGAANAATAIDIAMFVTLAYSWNIISGFTGYVSFGQVVFFGFGALFTGELIIHAGMTWYLAAVVGGIAAAIVAVPVGIVMLRLRGIYFALGMFGLAYVVSLLCSRWSYTGGSTGLVIPGSLAQNQVLIGLTCVAVLAFLVNAYMARSPFGLRAMAVRDDEQVAEAMGVRTMQVKVTAFALSALLPAIVGGFIAYYRAFIDASSVFDAQVDLQVIVFVLAGGIGTVWGPLIGAAVLTIVNNQLSDNLPDWQLAVFGALIIVITLYLPGGVASIFNRFGWLRRDIIRGPKRIRARDELEALLPRADDGAGATGELLACRDVGVAFGGVHALQGVDFVIERGTSTFIIGANGAGKTTLFNTITGLVKPSSGTISFDGVPVGRSGPHALARSGIGRTFQIPRPFESMTVWENVLAGALGGRARGSAVRYAEWVIRVLEMEDICYDASATLPVGHRRMLELARALALAPKLILLDEVMAGMSDEELQRVRSAIRQMRSFGVEAIVGVEHVIKAIVDLCDEIVVLDRGRRIVSGPPEEILRHPEVVRAYLGTAEED